MAIDLSCRCCTPRCAPGNLALLDASTGLRWAKSAHATVSISLSAEIRTWRRHLSTAFSPTISNEVVGVDVNCGSNNIFLTDLRECMYRHGKNRRNRMQAEERPRRVHLSRFDGW